MTTSTASTVATTSAVEPTAIVELITPRKARRWLENKRSNRTVNQRYVAELAASMSAGRWAVNGEAIVIDAGGHLIDGQHRLSAVIRAEIEIPMLVVRGVRPEAFTTIDTGLRRTFAHVCSAMKIPHATHVASGAHWIWKYLNGLMLSSVRPSHDLASEFLEEHPDIVSAAETAAKMAHILAPSIATFGIYTATRADQDGAATFVNGVVSGEGLSKRDPAYKLREVLIKNRGGMRQVRPAMLAAWWVKCWNAYQAGRPIGLVRFCSDETFPVVSGFPPRVP